MIDSTALLASFTIANWARSGPLQSSPILFAVSALIFYFIIAGDRHAYSAESLRRASVAVRRSIQSLTWAMGVALLIVFFTKTSTAFPRLTIGAGSVGAFFLMATMRYYFVRNLERAIGGNPFQSLLIVDGDARKPNSPFTSVIQADRRLDPNLNAPELYGHMAASARSADRIVVACPPERRAAWARVLKGADIQGEIYMPELSVFKPLGMENVRGETSLIVAAGPLNLMERSIKRAFDLSVAVTMIILLSPILLMTAIAIKVESPGPVLFRQKRFGRGNEMFSVLKFRSMYVDSSDHSGNRSTARDDRRVTRVGRFIRRTSIDELPQLFNVLIGNMSIVGPRPHAAGSRAENKLFWEVDRRYWERHTAKPGLTGLAQIRGFRGATERERDLLDRLDSDLEYLQGWTIWSDIKIVILTIKVVLHRNAF
ncbi:exopolysaccharide biosynthesis polyprenyl glycosylphosphotransferase [Stakelama marina]|uniref:Exopolysaccharide biosynthesis polyprenyl glycosylphosphotransferase n=1 Tax=Stakelama marina TaxID=2826939 RepID=A0A8T4IE12_9SPHN|nr:exopolysaccharide biosynthesis polyprenyl glycosylphosphotransferase [Stakelama marina]MBR0552094.1 exopolysaccharide biosynthesis polyprenyl glycosylphosphotransferase [Stakelama marina]